MSNAYTAQVNRQLFAASAHLKLLPEPENGNKRIVLQALLESSLFHLVLASQAYFRELASNYQLADVDSITQISDLEQRLQVAGKTPAEASELEVLSIEGWLGDAFQSFAVIGRERFVAQHAEPKTDSMIPMTELTNKTSEPKQLTPEQLSEWIEKFREMLNRHREIMVEY